MKKLLIATVIGALSATMLVSAPSAFAQGTTAKKTAKRPAPAKRIIPRSKKAQARAAAKVDPVPDGAVKWSCKDGLSFDLAGDMKRDQLVTVHWAKKNYKLPREATTTGADTFYDPAAGFKLVVIPSKAMLFTDANGGERLADECVTPEMAQGSAAPTQANELKPAVN
ncbi:hypothetical protein DN523_02255 [Burkholderia multivorans]|jgi:hypothetical protein|uniref:Uncharacterized protein n=1 Tax=Burkholderia multivorans TaxID=87883 RepID=A0ABD7LB75_9BURK|nr:hypothetical protein [Burkholderia multivorans]KHS19260.1 signal peptide protein [Burkholderia multivorans]KHS19721.1 signal peptide protein [Burkholderia multivorans]KVT48547.1 hypothetical protein WK52_05715 [Burkholderia multivorans]MBR7900787.1 hypothetical protein [Burkholderia multivorans]MBR7924417.1 hypothetical protein [Burkholderia multivorans]